MNPLVSIIIPTYNRAHLIGETLDSIISQTYNNWECLIVDDGSTDNTLKVVEEITLKEKRIKYFLRPSEHLAGGNGARNYGLIKAEGAYVVFFDSDDLMTKDHLEVKINSLENTNVDYVISKTKNFNGIDTYLESRYKLIKTELTAENYIIQRINWLTPDICIKVDLAKSIIFREDLQSGQEYNYFSKLVLKSVNAFFIEKYLTLRRIHEKSIRSGLKVRAKKMQSAYISCWFTYLDIRIDADKQIRKGLLFRCISMIFKEREVTFPYQFSLVKTIFKEFGIWVGINFLLMLFFSNYFNKGYLFRQNISRSLIK